MLTGVNQIGGARRKYFRLCGPNALPQALVPLCQESGQSRDVNKRAWRGSRSRLYLRILELEFHIMSHVIR